MYLAHSIHLPIENEESALHIFQTDNVVDAESLIEILHQNQINDFPQVFGVNRRDLLDRVLNNFVDQSEQVVRVEGVFQSA